MPLQGGAFLALWNDFDPELAAEYEAWHTFEHVPERLNTPGFLSSRRYGAACSRYFTLYEMDDLAALDSREYQALIDSPTIWSTAMRRSFRNFMRLPCRRIASGGQGIAGALLPLAIKAPQDPARCAPVLVGLLEGAVCQGRLTAFTLGLCANRPGYQVFRAGGRR